jgi:hypothetical protein
MNYGELFQRWFTSKKEVMDYKRHEELRLCFEHALEVGYKHGYEDGKKAEELLK